MANKRVLILSYSYSHQTRNLLKTMVAGMDEENIDIVRERLEPEEYLRFPIGTIPSTFVMMGQSFFRKRYPIKPLNEIAFQDWDLIIVAGPTWSYNPSGPVLSLLDRDGKKLFKNQTVLPMISCRGYWRVHFWGLKSLLNKCGAKAVQREDETEEAISHRLETYNEKTAPLIGFYKEAGLLLSVPATSSDAVIDAVKEKLSL